eukprot:3293696-Rhodomonas_salina.2
MMLQTKSRPPYTGLAEQGRIYVSKVKQLEPVIKLLYEAVRNGHLSQQVQAHGLEVRAQSSRQQHGRAQQRRAEESRRGLERRDMGQRESGGMRQ